MINNLQWAKQRFNSNQKPLSRLILFFDAIWATAVEVAIVRRGSSTGPDGRSPALEAAFFLEQCTAERIFQAAMVADAAEENLEVVRLFDNPGGKGYDLTHVAHQLHSYLNKLDYLFVGEEADCLKCGYTSYMVEEILKRPRVAVVTKGRTFSIGGPGSVDAAMLTRCLARMACYVRLATQCVNVEFPGWRCLLAFTVFDVSDDRRKATGFSHDSEQDCWQGLGKLPKQTASG